jgi:hypothetical protein
MARCNNLAISPSSMANQQAVTPVALRTESRKKMAMVAKTWGERLWHALISLNYARNVAEARLSIRKFLAGH